MGLVKAAEEVAKEAADDKVGELVEAAKEVKAKKDATRDLLAQRAKDAVRETESNKEKVKALQSRFNKASAESTKPEKTAKDLEEKYTAKKTLAEAAELIATLETHEKKIAEAAKPFTALSKEECVTFATPATLAEEVESLRATAAASLTEVKAALKALSLPLVKSIAGPLA